MQRASVVASVDLDALWAASYPWMKRLAWMLVGSNAAAEDAVSDAWVRALPRLHAMDEPGAYLRRTLVNVCRNRARHERVVDRHRVVDLPPSEVGEELVDLARALDRLPERQRAAVVLRYLHDLDVEEIADLLDCRPATVRSNIRHAVTALRRTLA